MSIISMIEIIISILTAIGGWEAIRYVLNRKAERRKSEAEAGSAETAATKEVQDVYQQLISDVKVDRDEQRQYISELKNDRRQLREERDELRERIDRTDETVRQLQREVARNGRMVEAMRPFLCGLMRCKQRQPMTISETGEVKTNRTTRAKPDKPKGKMKENEPTHPQIQQRS